MNREKEVWLCRAIEETRPQEEFFVLGLTKPIVKNDTLGYEWLRKFILRNDGRAVTNIALTILGDHTDLGDVDISLELEYIGLEEMRKERETYISNLILNEIKENTGVTRKFTAELHQAEMKIFGESTRNSKTKWYIVHTRLKYNTANMVYTYIFLKRHMTGNTTTTVCIQGDSKIKIMLGCDEERLPTCLLILSELC